MKSDLIIDPSDFRYGKLGHLWKLYSFDNLIKFEEGSRIKYFVPSELMIRDYVTQKINLRWDKTGDNWITTNALHSVLSWSCELTVQDYFDLLILHINDRSNRPRCITCKERVPFSNRVTLGYNQSVHWNLVTHTYCCNSCAKVYHSTHLDEYPLVAENQINFGYYAHLGDNSTKNSRARFLSLGGPEDLIKFYLARTYDGYLKFGLTASKLTDRSFREQFNSGHKYEAIHKIIELTRVEAANLESRIKLKFDNSEYLNWSDFKLLKEEIRSLLVNRPITNPFD